MAVDPKKSQSPRSKPARVSPTYIPMGLEKDMMVRLNTRLRSELMHAYKKCYRGLPAPGFGAFVAFCAAKGLDVVLETYARSSPPEGESGD